MTRSRIHEPRYLEVIHGLQAFDDFDRLWELANDPKNVPQPPYIFSLFSPIYGKLTYRFSTSFVPPSLEMYYWSIFYSPYDDYTATVFQKVAEQPARVYRFSREVRLGYVVFE